MLKLSYSVLAILLILFINVKSSQYLKVQKYECDFSSKYFYPNSTCFARQITRNQSEITLKFWTLKPNMDINVSHTKNADQI